MSEAVAVRCRNLVAGEAEGTIVVLSEPLSLWGGFDPHTGRVIDRRHPQHGARLSGAMTVVTAGRGSSSASSVLLEAIRLGTAPSALLLAEADGILALGAVVGRELYERAPAVVVVPRPVHRSLADGARARIDAAGDLTVETGRS